MKRKHLFVVLSFGLAAVAVAVVLYINREDLGIKTDTLPRP